MKFKPGDRVVITDDWFYGVGATVEKVLPKSRECYILCDKPIPNFQFSDDDWSAFARSTHVDQNTIELEEVFNSPLYKALL